MLDIKVDNQKVTFRKADWIEDADMIVDLTCMILFVFVNYNMENNKNECDYKILEHSMKLHDMLDCIESSIKNNKGTFSGGING